MSEVGSLDTQAPAARRDTLEQQVHPLEDLSLLLKWRENTGHVERYAADQPQEVIRWLLYIAEKIGEFEGARAALYREDHTQTVPLLAQALWACTFVARTLKVPPHMFIWHGEKMGAVRLGALLSHVLRTYRCGDGSVAQPLSKLMFALQTGISQRDASIIEVLRQVVVE